jgi:hypothetical protein
MQLNNHFTDINFKLAVIQVLMYEKGLLNPTFKIEDFASRYKGREIDLEEEGYGIIPEALYYFEDLEISTHLLAQVDEIYQDGGNEIYLEIFPYWDGEDDLFNIKSTEDLKLVPNLDSMTLFYDDAKKMVDAFKAKGIDAEYL